MHVSSLENMQQCYQKFVKTHPWPDRKVIDVIDIGGSNVNGSYADIFSGQEFHYRSVDIDSDNDVDIVLEDPYALPFMNESQDIIISGQAFEHVEFFWLLFEEMTRVLKPDGLLILIAPSSGPIHRYPVDCYRFYPDAYHALANYCHCELLYLKHDQRGPWQDLVGVFTKSTVKINFDASREWQNNRYEQATNPVPLIHANKHPEIDRVAGEMPYLEVLQHLHKERRPSLYLEIGLRHGHSFKLAMEDAIGIDPEPDIKVELSPDHRIFQTSSDDFFEQEVQLVLAEHKVDMAFIDGMHLFEFALRDFINIEAHARPESLIIIDDIYPNHPVQAQRHRESIVWTGDVWKLAVCLEQERSDLNLTYLDTSPTGLLLISNLDPSNRSLTQRYNPLVRKYQALNLENEVADKFLKREDAMSPKHWLKAN